MTFTRFHTWIYLKRSDQCTNPTSFDQDQLIETGSQCKLQHCVGEFALRGHVLWIEGLKMDEMNGFQLLLLSKTEVRLSLQSDIDLIAPKCLLEWHL